jgi:hypothetical protein
MSGRSSRARRRENLRPDAVAKLLELSLEELMALRRAAIAEMDEAQRVLNTKKNAVTNLSAAVKAKKDEDPDMFGVSDHAVLRWLQRVEGVDIKAVRAKIREHAKAKTNPELDDQIIDAGDGISIAVSQGCSVTTVWRGGKPQ